MSKAAPFPAGTGGAFSKQDQKKATQETLKVLKGPERTVSALALLDCLLAGVTLVCVWRGYLDPCSSTCVS